MKIIGAGLSGLLAGCLIPGSTVYEHQKSLPNNHGAILRFRSDKISKALNIPFKKVRVTKAIWLDGQEVAPAPRIQNMYSQKVLGRLSQRSISNIDPVDRYIAPPDFIQQLADRCNILYDRYFPADFYSYDTGKLEGPIISTIPMPVMINQLLKKPDHKYANFEKRPIWTYTNELPGANIYQTIYFPGFDTSLYRASFTGDKIILEFCSDPSDVGIDWCEIGKAFGILKTIFESEPVKNGKTKNNYGKIAPIDNDVRRSIMATLTHDYGIYSLGRFATWRNILLDDVFDDIFKIMDLMRLDDYSRKLALAGA